MLLLIIELTVARDPVKTPVCADKEEMLLPTRELVLTVKVDTEVKGGGVNDSAVKVPTFKLSDEMAPPIRVFVVIELV